MGSYNYETIDVSVLEGIMTCALNRPDNLNSINRKMLEELIDLCEKLMFDMEIRVLILKGNGDKGFSSGFDIADIFQPQTLQEGYNYSSRFADIIMKLRRIPQPVISAVHGPAIGAGFCMVLASDIRVISTDSRFSTYFIRVGIGGADMGCSYFLPRLIGGGRANEYMLTGKFMGAQDAMNLGLCSRLVEKDEITATAEEIARDISAKDPLAVRVTKEAINANLEATDLHSAMQFENRNQTVMMAWQQSKALQN